MEHSACQTIPAGHRPCAYRFSEWNESKRCAVKRGWLGTAAAGALLNRSGTGQRYLATLFVPAVVLHISREGLHHSAEILTLRDLYRNRTEEGTFGRLPHRAG